MKFNVIAQYHPAAALHQPRLWSDMRQDWEFLPDRVDSDFKIIPEGQLDLSLIKIAALDTETDGAGGIGQWSIAYRLPDGTLAVTPFYGPRPALKWTCPLIFHNAKYDIRELRAHNMSVPEEVHDTMILAYCCGLGKQATSDDSKKKSGSDMVGGLGLKYLARRQLGMVMRTWKDMRDHPEWVPEYNANDSVATLLLFEKLLKIAPKHYFEIDMPLLKVLMAMEDKGVHIDPDFLVEYGQELDKSLAEYALPLNPFSTDELQSYIYGTLEIEPWKFTDKGEPSVEEEVLEQIHDPVLDLCLEYKHLFKDRKTYVENYIKMKDKNNRIHPELKQTSTSTRRLSCAKPNLQNVFKKGERIKLRALFSAKKGFKIVRMDYDQLDFKALGAITQDEKLLAAFKSGKKIHTVTSEEMNLPYDQAKIANFAVMFKVEPWSLSIQMGCSIDEAKDFMARYFQKFPAIKRYQDETEKIVREEKRVTIPFENAVRRIDSMYSENWKIMQAGVREGINLPVQGLESYVVKRAMLDLYYKHNLTPILQIHDELLFEVEEEKALEFACWLKEYIPTIVGELGGVSFAVEVGIGNNWYEAGLKENTVKGE